MLLDKSKSVWDSKMTDELDKFQGTDDYIVSPDLKDIVNVAIALQHPLLVRG